MEWALGDFRAVRLANLLPSTATNRGHELEGAAGGASRRATLLALAPATYLPSYRVFFSFLFFLCQWDIYLMLRNKSGVSLVVLYVCGALGWPRLD